MADISEIQEHTPVVGSDGSRVGIVDHVEGDRIKLTKSDPSAGGEHHFIPTDMVASVSGQQVRLSCTSEEAREEWTEES